MPYYCHVCKKEHEDQALCPKSDLFCCGNRITEGHKSDCSLRKKRISHNQQAQAIIIEANKLYEAGYENGKNWVINNPEQFGLKKDTMDKNAYCMGWWDAMDACRERGVPTALNIALNPKRGD